MLLLWQSHAEQCSLRGRAARSELEHRKKRAAAEAAQSAEAATILQCSRRGAAARSELEIRRRAVVEGAQLTEAATILQCSRRGAAARSELEIRKRAAAAEAARSAEAATTLQCSRRTSVARSELEKRKRAAAEAAGSAAAATTAEVRSHNAGGVEGSCDDIASQGPIPPPSACLPCTDDIAASSMVAEAPAPAALDPGGASFSSLSDRFASASASADSALDARPPPPATGGGVAVPQLEGLAS